MVRSGCWGCDETQCDRMRLGTQVSSHILERQQQHECGLQPHLSLLRVIWSPFDYSPPFCHPCVLLALVVHVKGEKALGG